MEKLTGVIDHFLYRNETNGYGVMEMNIRCSEALWSAPATV